MTARASTVSVVNPNAATRPSDRVVDANGSTPPLRQVEQNARQLGMAVQVYLVSTTPRSRRRWARRWRRYVNGSRRRSGCSSRPATPAGSRRCPATVSADWVDRNTSFVYLGGGGGRVTRIRPGDRRGAAADAV